MVRAMTPEQITNMIQALGYPICVSIAMWVIFKQQMARNFKVTDTLIQSQQSQIESAETYAHKLTEVSERSNASLDRNSVAVKENTVAMREMTGKLCRFPS